MSAYTLPGSHLGERETASDQAHSSRAGRGQNRWRSAPATTPAPGLRRDELKLLAGAACASQARCAHYHTSACHHALVDRPTIS